MPWAKIEGDVRLDQRWTLIPEKHRAAAKAVYFDAVLYSAEMLTDGALNRAVLVAITAEIGIKRPGFVFTSLAESGLFAVTKQGFSIVDWRDYHSSREEVMAIREREKEKKREQRKKREQGANGQLQIDNVPLASPRDTPRDEAGDSRARARVRSSAAASTTEQELPPHAPSFAEEQSGSAAAASETEPPRATRIRETVEQLPGHDPGSTTRVEAIARQLPAATYERVLEQTLTRRNVTNRVGLLVTLLEAELSFTHRAAQAAVAANAATHNDTSPEASLRLHVPAMANLDDDQVFDHVDKLLDRHRVTADERIRLTDVAADILEHARAAGAAA